PRRGSKDEDGKPFRGLNCPVCHSQLVYDLESGSVRCDSCGEKFTFVKSTRSALGKENPDIIITNMWALETRMMDNNEYDLNVHSLLDVGIIVIDEAHEYKGLGGGLVSNLIKLLLSHSRRDTTVVISSATMPFAKDFASKLTGIPRDEIKEYNFHQIISELRNEIKIGGRRLVLIGIFDINPRFSWSTYCQLWAVSMAFLNHAYTVDDRQYVPQSIIFIDNIKELRRTYRGYEENISLGEPRDHLIGPKILGKSPHSLDSYSYWQYLSRNKRSEFLELFGKGGRLDELIERVAEVHSLIKEEERRKVIEALERGEKIGVIFSTSALELGVDYQNVSFILNVGLSDPLSLAQRVGRGGRSFNSLRTVLGIILTRNLPSETLLAHSPDVGRRLDPSAREYMEQIPVASDNPQVKKRGKIVECISSMARKGKRTYESGRGIREYAELQEFFSDLISEMRGAFS
ncbi:MAG: helicase-related protein, partial [Candidatus Bathyarchaeia archaeon]